MTSYIVIQQHAWMNEYGHGVDYSWDRWHFISRDLALDHGYRETGTDDFNIGTLDDRGRLVAFGFGTDDFGPDEDGEPFGGYDLAEIAHQINTPGGAA